MGIMGLMSEPLVTMGVVGDLSNRTPSGKCAYFVSTSPNLFLCVFFLGSFTKDMRGICWYLEPWPNCSKPSFRVCYWKGPVNSRTAFHLDFHDENLSNVPHGHREGRVCWALQGGAGLKWHGAFGLKCFGCPDLGLLCFLFCTWHNVSSLVIPPWGRLRTGSCLAPVPRCCIMGSAASAARPRAAERYSMEDRDTVERSSVTSESDSKHQFNFV